VTHHEEDGPDCEPPGPRENTDPATKADMGMTGTPARSYSPKGMAPDEDDATSTAAPEDGRPSERT
jgi:hypothetical protein